jgi:hypothetical protein
MTRSQIRSLLAAVAAGLIVFGMVSQLNWSDWQPIGWAVIVIGGYLAVTHLGGLEQPQAWLVGGPALGFLVGYTALRLTKPYWLAIDVVSIAALALYAVLEWRSDAKQG